MRTLYVSIEEEVFNNIQKILAEIIGEEELKIVGVTRNSRFVFDLMIDSIHFVFFAEQLNALYGKRVNFFDWYSKMSLKQFTEITVGEVSGFIAKTLFAQANKGGVG